MCTSLIFILNEVIRFNHIVKPHVPTPKSLLQAIYRPLQLAQLFRKLFRWISFKLHHIHLFLKVFIEEDSLYIHLLDFIVIVCNNDKKNSNWLYYNSKRESLIIINSLPLTITIHHKPYFEIVNLAIKTDLFLKDPLYLIGTMPSRRSTKF